MIHLKGGRVIDPANNRDGVGDVFIANGRIAAQGESAKYETIDVSGKIVMAGGIDIHSHIAGGNVNAARLMLPGPYGAQDRHPTASALPACAILRPKRGGFTRKWASRPWSNRR